MRRKLLGIIVLFVGVTVGTGVASVVFLASVVYLQVGALGILVLFDIMTLFALVVSTGVAWNLFRNADPTNVIQHIERRAAFWLSLGVTLAVVQGVPARILAGAFLARDIFPDNISLLNSFDIGLSTAIFLVTFITGVYLLRSSGAKPAPNGSAEG